MLRRGLGLLERKDMVKALLVSGRLVDIQMLHFFNGQVEREVAARGGAPLSASEAATAAAKATAATTTAQTAAAAPAEAETAAASVAPEVLAVRARNKERLAALEAFQAQCTSVRQAAAKAPLSWMGQVYGEKEWCSSFLAANVVAASGEAGNVRLSGRALVAGSGPTPATVQVMARAGATTVRAVRVSLAQPDVTATRNGDVLSLELRGAEGVVVPEVDPADIATRQHVLNAAAYAGILSTLEEVCALHATHTARYDGLLIRNPAVQMRLAQIACFRYGVETLSSYVVGDGEAVESAVGLLGLPLAESTVLSVYAESALMDGLDCAWEVVRDTPLVAAVPHRSKASKTIRYPYMLELFNAPKYALTSMDGAMETQIVEFLAPMVRELRKREGGDLRGWVNQLLGFSSGTLALAAPHTNLKVCAKRLESDLTSFIELALAHPSKDDPVYAITVAQYLAEVFASVAVIYRCTAALNMDERGLGHREWLLTQTFSAASTARRQKILSDFRMATAARKALGKTDLDSYSTHPLELMNTNRPAPEEKKAAADATASAGKKSKK